MKKCFEIVLRRYFYAKMIAPPPMRIRVKWALSVVRVLITEPRNGIVDRDLDQDEERIT